MALQPLACVLYALEQLPDLKGSHVAVIGQGSIGLLFSYAAKALGARQITGVDPIDRDEIGREFGVDDVQAAFELACRPTPERIKIAISVE